MVVAAWLPYTEPAQLLALVSIASLAVIVGAVVVIAVCWIAFGRR